MLRGRKLGLLLSTEPNHPNFKHGVRLASAALAQGVDVYLYCIDEAIQGVVNPELQSLKSRGLKLFACAYARERRNLSLQTEAVFSGLTTLSDLMAGTDRFVSFN
jgi:sulfur relay (sulfurtransferase) complex TusBCD TusD component (DsrE family)